LRDPLRFLPGVAEQLAHYVYALIDPRNGEVFYVGKGVGDRAYAHARQAKKVDPGKSRNELKLNRIKEIHAKGKEVRVEILRYGMSEANAYEAEAIAIDACRMVGASLTNVVAGHGQARGWQPFTELMIEMAAQPVDIAPDHRVILIRPVRLYRPDMSSKEVYEVTRKWWILDKRRKDNVDYAFCVYRGIVRAVYRIHGWHEAIPGAPAEEWEKQDEGRWCFRGRRNLAMEQQYVGRDVSHIWARGAQGSVRYVNC
jgi:uncharacterized protein